MSRITINRIDEIRPQFLPGRSTKGSGAGTADVKILKVFTPDDDSARSQTESSSQGPDTTSLNIDREGNAFTVVQTEGGASIKFEVGAYGFAVSEHLTHYAKLYADIIEQCFGKQATMGCSLYRDPEVGDQSLVFDATIVDDPTVAVRQMEDFRRRVARALPAPSRQLFRLLFHTF